MNRLSSVGLVVLSFTAQLVVLWGYTQPPLPDEGAGAHIFQLSVAALVPMTIVFRADWRQPRRSAWSLALAAPAVVLAVSAQYYLEQTRLLPGAVLTPAARAFRLGL
jgi:hypothetical protein